MFIRSVARKTLVGEDRADVPVEIRRRRKPRDGSDRKHRGRGNWTGARKHLDTLLVRRFAGKCRCRARGPVPVGMQCKPSHGHWPLAVLAALAQSLSSMSDLPVRGRSFSRIARGLKAWPRSVAPWLIATASSRSAAMPSGWPCPW